jgi:CDP-glycerol glycerophosphotransferase
LPRPPSGSDEESLEEPLLPVEPRVRTALRHTEQRLPQRLRRRLRTVSGRLPELRDTPLVSLVVACPADGAAAPAAALGATLDSLRDQQHRNLEILVLREADRPDQAETARRHAAEDFRIVARAHPCGSVAAARNRGARLARGAYVGFVRPGDALPPSAVADLVGALEESGSDFAFGRLTEVGGLRRDVAAVEHPAHTEDRRSVSLAEFPEAVTDTHDENRLYRADFWALNALAFPEAGGGATPALRSLVAAGSFDVLAAPTYQRSAQAAGRPVGAESNALDELDAWLAVQQDLADLLDGGDLPAMRQAWVRAVCDTEAVPFLDDAERATAEQWERLVGFLVRVHAAAAEETWRQVRAESRVKVWLAVNGHREPLEQLVAERLFEHGNRRTEVVDGRVLARFPGVEELLAGREELLELAEGETPLRVHLRSVRWRADHVLELTVFAAVPFVDLGDRSPELSAFLLHPESGERVPLRVEPRVDPEANAQVGHRHQDYSHGAAVVLVDVEDLPAPTGAPVGWRPWFVLTTRGVVRAGSVTSRDERTSAGLLTRAVRAPRTLGERHVGVAPAGRGGVRLVQSRPPRVGLVEGRTEGRTLRGVLSGVPEREGWDLVAEHETGAVASCRLVAGPGPDRHSFELALPDPAPGGRATTPASRAALPRGWRLRVAPGGGAGPGAQRPAEPWPVALPLAPPADDRPFLPGTTHAEVALARDASGHLEAVETATTLVVTDVAVVDRSLRVTGEWVGPVPADWSLTLRTRRATLRAGGRGARELTALVPTTWDEWGLGVSPVPPGAYQLAVTAGSGSSAEPVRVLVGGPLVDRLLRPVTGPDHRVAVARSAQGLVVRLSPLLADDERGPFAQQRLQRWYQHLELPVDGSAVYLQSYTGTGATDSPLAIHEELRRTRPDLTLYWGVASAAAPVPPGAVPLLMYSREWYRVLATARYLVSNIDFDRWFRRRPGQFYLQTFHGYPAKAMGLGFWEAKQFTQRRIELELDRTSRNWTLILTPCPEMDRHYREQYAYTGPIESAGYPRDDVLVSEGAGERRDRTRALLGIRSGQTAVLYAPTWRDDQALQHRSAAMVTHLDLERAADALGDGYVLLMRGHRFHAKGVDRSGRSARILDVTDYPEVNDLILASDAAVLDYSSMRFDFALTGRPMLFLVPDLGDYTGGVRGFLFPFEESAPGPLLQDTDGVVAALRDLPGVAAEHAEAYRAFNARFNHLQDGRAARRVVDRFFT